jgi:hypothetical protein
VGIKDWIARITGQARPADPAPAVPVSPAAPTEADILAALDRVQAMIAGGVVPGGRPVAGPTRVDHGARHHAAAAQPRAGQPRGVLGDGDRDRLPPEAIGGYTRLPRRWADSRPIENGKTSLMLLIDQLDLLGATMDKIFDAVVRVDADALIAHGRFCRRSSAPPRPAAGSTSVSSRRRAAPQLAGPAMTDRDDDGRSLTETVRAHAEAVRAQLARITALRAANPGHHHAPRRAQPARPRCSRPAHPGPVPGGRTGSGRADPDRPNAP